MAPARAAAPAPPPPDPASAPRGCPPPPPRRRPGAKFEDIEARPHDVVRLPSISQSSVTTGYDVSLERWTREPSTAVPTDWHYADVQALDGDNHADGFVRHPPPTGDVLHLQL